MEKLIHHEIDSSQEKGIIIVSDLGLIDDSILISLCKQVFSEVMKKNWRAIWLDHHTWSSNANEVLKPYIDMVLDESGNKCAADLMYEKFLAGNELAYRLASMAHSMDFFTGAEYLTPTAELICYSKTLSDYCKRLTILAQKAARGILWDVEMQGEYNKYVKLRDIAKGEAFSSMRIEQINGYKVVFIRSSPYIQNSLFAQEIFDKTSADVAMLYSSDGNVSIRRNNNSIACNEIAANLPSGGGHKFAAGASYYSSPLDTNSIISELHQAVLETLKRRESR
jgi:uncharacterized protein